MDDVKDVILQSKNVEYVKNTFGKEQWIQVSGNNVLNGADAEFWCGLVAVDHIEKALQSAEWDLSPNCICGPGFEGGIDRYQYKRELSNEGLEPILYYREFYGVKPNYVEISQEYILLNNLRYDSSSKAYLAMYDTGESEEAVKYIDDTTILMKMKFLRNYAAAKQMVIMLYFDIRAKADGKLLDYDLKESRTEFRNDYLLYDLWSGDMEVSKYAYSVLMGKKYIMPLPVYECGYWPYENKETYEDFIIGIDEYGREITYTCDPDRLANYYGANPEAPMYLTPVFFNREVLQKYYSKPELYEIRDGRLDCKSLWGIEIDNHHKNCVSVYLGDLGRDLPESERSYWKSFNIVGEEQLSKVAFQRDFLNIPVQSNMADHRFLNTYKDISKQWEEKYGWPLFIPLSEEDEYNLSYMRIPVTDSQAEFDQLVLSLVKTIIDSLNEKELRNAENAADNQKGISKLENWLMLNGATDYEEHICFLRDLQKLRSTGTGHRKGEQYDRISKKFGLVEKRKKDVFEDILERAIVFLDYLSNTFLQQ